MLAGNGSQVVFMLGTTTVVYLAIAVALHLWARSLADRAGSGWRWIQRLPLAGFALLTCGLGGTVIGLVHAFSAVQHVDASQKSHAHAVGSSEAMGA